MEFSDRMRRLLEAAKKLARERKTKEATDELIAAIKARVQPQSGKDPKQGLGRPTLALCCGRRCAAESSVLAERHQ